MKKILVLTGSPRLNGNSDSMAEAFIKGAKSTGNEILRYNTGNKNIKGCRACNTCFRKEKACSFNDDFEELAPLYEQADSLVIVTPLYYYSFPSELKSAIDKMYAFDASGRKLSINECLLLVCGATDREKDFEGIVRSYELIAEFEKWDNRGHMIVPAVDGPDDINKIDALEKIEELGRNF
jgi:multimeric flavodoxin WrbA